MHLRLPIADWASPVVLRCIGTTYKFITKKAGDQKRDMPKPYQTVLELDGCARCARYFSELTQEKT